MTTPAKKRPILVVDDEPEILVSLQSLLRREFQVFTANSGAEAVRVLQDQAVHLVMTDQRMPQMTGVDLLRKAKDEHPEAVRLIFTGYADVQAVIDAVNQGNIFRYVAKPWDPDALLQTLREAGEMYDRLAAREKLLADLRDHEARCIAFDDELQQGGADAVAPAVAAQLKGLFGEGRDLLARLGDALKPQGPLPPT